MSRFKLTFLSLDGMGWFVLRERFCKRIMAEPLHPGVSGQYHAPPAAEIRIPKAEAALEHFGLRVCAFALTGWWYRADTSAPPPMAGMGRMGRIDSTGEVTDFGWLGGRSGPETSQSGILAGPREKLFGCLIVFG
jgi:hypothetical protein